MEDEVMKAFENRLSSIEKTVNEIKDAVINDRLQQKDIEQIQDVLKKHEDKLSDLDTRLRNVEIAPDKEKASKWSGAIDMIFKFALTAVLAMVAVKTGLQ